jgi:hypothetical protein
VFRILYSNPSDNDENRKDAPESAFSKARRFGGTVRELQTIVLELQTIVLELQLTNRSLGATNQELQTTHQSLQYTNESLQARIQQLHAEKVGLNNSGREEEGGATNSNLPAFWVPEYAEQRHRKLPTEEENRVHLGYMRDGNEVWGSAPEVDCGLPHNVSFAYGTCLGNSSLHAATMSQNSSSPVCFEEQGGRRVNDELPIGGTGGMEFKFSQPH